MDVLGRFETRRQQRERERRERSDRMVQWHRGLIWLLAGVLAVIGAWLFGGLWPLGVHFGE